MGMNAAEANTAFAVICNWRGKALDDGERAAWKNRLWQWDAENFDIAISAWERSDKRHMRPSIGDLVALFPSKDIGPRYEEWKPEPRVDNTRFRPEDHPAIVKAREDLAKAKG